ncbi:MAG: aminotransferase class III-fold pyridoxal phosphate-dependent enzyme [Pseudomonadota bacterium]
MEPEAALDARDILAMNAFDPARDGEEAQATPGLLARRRANAGAASVLFYRRPIEMVRAEGCWMEAADGARYLDLYNNVPSVGHAHPRVVEAVSRQMARLNTNTRYLNAGVEAYLERLKALLPTALGNVVLSCTGSEANDLALRVAMVATGGEGFVATETAYHGNGHLTTMVSPSNWRRGGPPRTIRTVPPPSTERHGPDPAEGFAADVAAAFAALEAEGVRPAALIVDSIFSSDGVFPDPPGFLAPAAAAARAAGALVIADEVQPGFGRTGAGMWGYARHGIAPDMVTTGKPMANGFPMAATAARPEHLEAFSETFGYFNTFGGNPVAAAAGTAVLDVIEAEGLIENAARVGARLKAGLEAAARGEARVGAVRGAGLYLGVDVAGEGGPDPAMAVRLIDGLRDRRVMVGACGKYGHTLKIRPPLPLSEAEADRFLEAFDGALAATR